MATIRKRGSAWQVQVRKINRPLKTKTFRLKADAISWATRVEAELERDWSAGADLDLRKIRVRDLLARYRREVTPQKKSFAKESVAIDQLMNEAFANARLSDVSPADFSSFRDSRLKTVRPATVVRQLSILQNAFNVASRDWGWPIARNPVSSIRKPKIINQHERRVDEHELERLYAASASTRTPTERGPK